MSQINICNQVIEALMQLSKASLPCWLSLALRSIIQ